MQDVVRNPGHSYSGVGVVQARPLGAKPNQLLCELLRCLGLTLTITQLS